MKNIVKAMLLSALMLFSSMAYAATYKVKVYGEITDNKQAKQNLAIIQRAHEGDTIIIYINSPGGRIDILFAYQKALLNSGAHTISVVDNYDIAASAAGILAVSVDEPRLAPKAIWMAHMARAGDSPMRDVTVFIYSQCCTRVLTNSDMTRILVGGEIWLSGQEVMRRLNSPEMVQSPVQSSSEQKEETSIVK